MKTELWQRIHAARVASGITQDEIAQACGLTRVAVGHWESADPKRRTNPGIDSLRRVAELTGAPLQWLLDDNSEIHPSWTPPGGVVADDMAPIPILKNSVRDLVTHMLDHVGESTMDALAALGRDGEPTSGMSRVLLSKRGINNVGRFMGVMLEDDACAPEFRAGDGVIINVDAEITHSDWVALEAIDSHNLVGIRKLLVRSWANQRVDLSFAPTAADRSSLDVTIEIDNRSINEAIRKASKSGLMPCVYGKVMQLRRMYF